MHRDGSRERSAKRPSGWPRELDLYPSIVSHNLTLGDIFTTAYSRFEFGFR